MRITIGRWVVSFRGHPFDVHAVKQAACKKLLSTKRLNDNEALIY